MTKLEKLLLVIIVASVVGFTANVIAIIARFSSKPAASVAASVVKLPSGITKFTDGQVTCYVLSDDSPGGPFPQAMSCVNN